MNGQYILDENNNPKEVHSILEWAAWMQTANRIVQQDTIQNDIKISTIFLGLDHSFGGDIPILWETMIFGGKQDQYQERYASLEEAKKGHQIALELAKEEFNGTD